ncbi:MAG: 4'-phosphopantetheinyl transferase superfamily protein [Bacteroidota bacterium]
MKTQWEIASDFTLEETEVHIWRASLQVDPEVLLQHKLLLNLEEIARAERYHFEKDQRQYIVARSTLRRLLGQYLNRTPESIVLAKHSKEKPYLPHHSFEFNVSHAGDWAVFAFSHHPIGIDIEVINPTLDLETMATQFFAPAEVQAFLSISKPDRPQAFFNAWTRKEAFIKAIGDGLATPLDQFEVSLKAGEPTKLQTMRLQGIDLRDWELKAFDLVEGYCGAVAYNPTINKHRFHEINP